MKIFVNYNLYVVIDSENTAHSEGLPHCYVVKNSKEVAKIWLDNVSFEGRSNLSKEEEKKVLSVVRLNRYKLICEFNRTCVNEAV